MTEDKAYSAFDDSKHTLGRNVLIAITDKESLTINDLIELGQRASTVSIWRRSGTEL